MLAVDFEAVEQGWKAHLVDFSDVSAFGATKDEALVNALVLAMRVLLERVAAGQPVDKAIVEVRSALEGLVARIHQRADESPLDDGELSAEDEARLVELFDEAGEDDEDMDAEEFFKELGV
ncbi:MAG: hypothetical protein H6740_24725 [Alphaproteobacteria bacterium]|nr:hypothetical protein [Alphaproteobacteria bacterium]